MTAAANSMVTGFAHAGVTVRDMERSLPFYVDGLGLQCVSRRRVEDEYVKEIVQVEGVESIEVAFLALPNGQIAVELLQYTGGDPEDGSARPCDPGSGHVCLFVSEAHGAWKQAMAAGGTARSAEPVLITSGPHEGGYSGYLTDPDGYVVELIQPARPLA